MWNTTGHLQTKELLDRALQSGNFSHAYLFCGPQQIGKRTLALEFARKILQINDNRHYPDLIVVDNSKIKIEDMRNLSADLSLRPYSQSHKVAVIDNFEKATDEAANSILKTLEEPTPSTILILITANRRAVLPTIASRCQVLYMHSAEGKIGVEIACKNDAGFKAEFDADLFEWQKIRGATRLQRFGAIKRFADLEPERIEILLQRWLDAAQSELPNSYTAAQSISEALINLRRNFNKKLVFEKLFFNLTPR